MMDIELVEENERLMAELSRSNEELSSFAMHVAHDLKAPLRHIRAYSELLPSELGNLRGEDSSNYLDRIKTSCSAMEDLLDGLLNYARIGGGELKIVKVDLGDVVSEVLKEAEDTIQKLRISTEVEMLPTVWGDKLQIKQVFQNLIENSLKYRNSSRETSFLKVFAETPSNCDAQDKNHYPFVQIVVQDNGVGFDNKTAGRIFDLFHRLVSKSQFDGSGIGLATVKKIIDRHHGTIKADGILGVGATFTVTLPTDLQTDALSGDASCEKN